MAIAMCSLSGLRLVGVVPILTRLEVLRKIATVMPPQFGIMVWSISAFFVSLEWETGILGTPSGYVVVFAIGCWGLYSLFKG